MIQSIVSYCSPITLIGAGSSTPSDLTDALRIAPGLVAADGGAEVALAAGHMPDAVFGDFDSINEGARHQIPPDRLHHVAEQDSTDFQKVLMRCQAPLYLGVGFLGARLDHQLSALHSLLQFADRRIVLLGGTEIVLHVPQHFRIPINIRAVVSLFPLAPVSGQSTGLEWPIDGLHMQPGGVVGTSNRATDTQMSLTMDGPGMLLILPRDSLHAVTQALLGPGPKPLPWPVPASQYRDLPES